MDPLSERRGSCHFGSWQYTQALPPKGQKATHASKFCRHRGQRNERNQTIEMKRGATIIAKNAIPIGLAIGTAMKSKNAITATIWRRR